MVRASEQTPIVLDGQARTPTKVRAAILALLQCAPLTAFLQVADDRGKKMPTGQIFEIFIPINRTSGDQALPSPRELCPQKLPFNAT